MTWKCSVLCGIARGQEICFQLAHFSIYPSVESSCVCVVSYPHPPHHKFDFQDCPVYIYCKLIGERNTYLSDSVAAPVCRCSYIRPHVLFLNISIFCCNIYTCKHRLAILLVSWCNCDDMVLQVSMLKSLSSVFEKNPLAALNGRWRNVRVGVNLV